MIKRIKTQSWVNLDVYRTCWDTKTVGTGLSTDFLNKQKLRLGRAKAHKNVAAFVDALRNKVHPDNWEVLFHHLFNCDHNDKGGTR